MVPDREAVKVLLRLLGGDELMGLCMGMVVWCLGWAPGRALGASARFCCEWAQ